MKECAKGLLSRGMRDFTPPNDTLTPVIASVAKQSLPVQVFCDCRLFSHIIRNIENFCSLRLEMKRELL